MTDYEQLQLFGVETFSREVRGVPTLIETLSPEIGHVGVWSPACPFCGKSLGQYSINVDNIIVCSCGEHTRLKGELLT